MVKIEINGEDFSIDGYLKQKLDNIKLILSKDWDAVILVDGIEGSGKSTLSFVCGWYITDGKLTINNICEGTEDAFKKLEQLPKGSTLIIDEGSLMFSSKEVMRKEQRQLIKILQIIRQKCMCLIVVSPSFFDLNKYIAISRSRFLLHVYTDKKLNRGRFCYFSEKKKHKLYIFGKKNFNSYAKPRSDFVGTFSNFNPFGDEYLELKRKSLRESFKEDKKTIAPRHQGWLNQRDLLLRYIVVNKWSSQRGLERYFAENNVKMPQNVIHDAVRRSEGAISVSV